MTLYTILPPARTVFLGPNSNPLSGGSVFFYVPPNTTTLKATFQDAAGATPNTNPVILDGNGSALIYGSGQYLMQVWDASNNLVYTGLTQDNYGLVTTSNNVFTGTNDFTTNAITAATQSTGDSSTKVATTAFVQQLFSTITLPPLASPAITGYLPTNINGSTNTSASLSVTAGLATDSTGAVFIGPTNVITWAVANGNQINGYQGGTTLPNSATINFFVCKGTSGIGTFAVANSLTPSPPAGYSTYYRRIFSLTTNSSGALIAGNVLEVEGGSLIYYLLTPALDFASIVTSGQRNLMGLTVPGTIKVQPLYRTNVASVQDILLCSPDEPDLVPTSTGFLFQTAPGFDVTYNGSVILSPARDGILTTNTSSQIAVRSTANCTLYFVTRGFKDFRRS